MAAPRFILLIAMFTSLSISPAEGAASAERETVVLLHGLGRTRLSMQKLGDRIEAEGFRVINLAYPSTRATIRESAVHLRDELARQTLPTGQPVHFVTHSLGGIVLRAWLDECPMPNLGRVVMLSPPNQGSELTDRFMGGPLRIAYRLITGPAGQELGTGPDSTPNRLGPVKFPLGVITGDRTLNPFFSSAFPGPNDGKVSVERAKSAGMTDFLVVTHSHSFIMRSSRVTAETIYFLRHGRFSPSAA